jgi:uncharacterized protein (TIGR02246 family)
MMSKQRELEKPAAAEAAVRELYAELLACWNQRDAAAMAALYDKHANVTGFDGSQMNGPAEIEAEIGAVFRDHQTAAYVGKVREVRFLAPDVALLRAVVGMAPPGRTDINPAANAIQSLVATRQADQWRIALFQNTPAQFHGRPELVEALTEELRALL